MATVSPFRNGRAELSGLVTRARFRRGRAAYHETSTDKDLTRTARNPADADTLPELFVQVSEEEP
jgi:hypothetical protein